VDSVTYDGLPLNEVISNLTESAQQRADAARQAIVAKLENIKVDSVKYDGLPLTEVINNLAELARQRDPDKTGINFFFDRQALPTPAALGPFNSNQVSSLPANQPDATSVTVRISPGLSNVCLMDVLQAIAANSSPPVKYSILDYAVMLSLRGPEWAERESRTFNLDPNTFVKGLQGQATIGNGGGFNGTGFDESSFLEAEIEQREQLSLNLRAKHLATVRLDEEIKRFQGMLAEASTRRATEMELANIRAFLDSLEVDMDSNNSTNAGKMFVWNYKNKGKLLVRATPKDLAIIAMGIEKLNSAAPSPDTNQVKNPTRAGTSTNPNSVSGSDLKDNQAVTSVKKGWSRNLSGDETLIKTNPFVRTSAPNTGKGRQEITDKLKSIRLESVKYDGLPLDEVINNLSELARQRDPDNTGINFFFDRLTNQPDAKSVTVKILPGLSNVRLMDVLEAITKTSSPPVKYSIVDYAVMFSLRGPESASLETRTFHLDPNTFGGGLDANSAAAIEIRLADLKLQRELLGRNLRPEHPQITNLDELINKSQAELTNVSEQASSRHRKLKSFLESAGVDINTNNPANAGKAVVWNDRAGILVVRAEPKELDLVEAEVAKLNSLATASHTETNGAAVTDAPKPGQAKTDSANGNNLSTIKFHVDPNTFAQGLERVTGISFGNSPTAVPVQSGTNGSLFVGVTNGTSPEEVVARSFETAFRQYLASAGVDFDTNNPANAGKAIAWDNRRSCLVVSATTEDLKKVEAALEIINAVPPEVNLEIQFVSLEQAAVSNALGFNLNLGTIPTGSSVAGDSRPVSGGVKWSGVAKASTEMPLICGILTDPQYRATLAALSQRDGVNMPDALRITTEDMRNFQVKTDDTAAMLDLTPHVSTNKESIELSLVATLSEFVGYDTDAGLPLPLPLFHSKIFTNSTTVPDGQTLVLGANTRSTNGNLTVTKNLIFVTPTLINPDGTRFHRDSVPLPPQAPPLPGQPAK
jgi:hypothetical protein